MTLGELDDLIAGFEDAARPLDDFLPGSGQRDALRRAFDELHAEISLELFQLRRERRLAHEAALGRASEVARIRDRDEITQVLELEVRHRCALSSLYIQSIGRNRASPGKCASTRETRSPRSMKC